MERRRGGEEERRRGEGRIIRPDANGVGSRRGDDIHISGDISGDDPIDLNVLLAPFVRECFGELAESAFGRCVCGDGEASLKDTQKQSALDTTTTCRNVVRRKRQAQIPDHLTMTTRRQPAKPTSNNRATRNALRSPEAGVTSG